MKNEKNLRMLTQKLNIHLKYHLTAYATSFLIVSRILNTTRFELSGIPKEGHIKGFRTSPEFKPFFEAVRPFFNDIQEMRHYNITDIKGEKS
jgi:hypothetical protein